jgi:high-affinity nickel-transport protein
MMRIHCSTLAGPPGKSALSAVITGISAFFIAVITLGGVLASAFGLRDPLTM